MAKKSKKVSKPIKHVKKVAKVDKQVKVAKPVKTVKKTMEVSKPEKPIHPDLNAKSGQKPFQEDSNYLAGKRLSAFTINVENVVSFASLGIVIALEKLVEEVENTEYEPEQFPGLVYRPQNPRAAALIFSSGKIVCTGAKSIDNSKLAMQKVAEKINEIGIKTPKKFDIIIENIVASSKIDAKINLEEIAFMLENAEYEPEQFPGLVYRISEPRVAFLLFSSGKIICTGAHSIVDIHRALEKFKIKLEEIGIDVKPSKTW